MRPETEQRLLDFSRRYGKSADDSVDILLRLGLALCENAHGRDPMALLASMEQGGPAAPPFSSLSDAPARPQVNVPVTPPSRPTAPAAPAAQDGDQRRHPRVNVRLSGKCEHLDSSGTAWKPFQAEIVDVSMMGVRLKIPDHIQLYPGYTVNLHIPGVGVEAQGQVRYISRAQNRPGLVDIGMELTTMSRPHWLRWMELIAS